MGIIFLLLKERKNHNASMDTVPNSHNFGNLLRMEHFGIGIENKGIENRDIKHRCIEHIGIECRDIKRRCIEHKGNQHRGTKKKPNKLNPSKQNHCINHIRRVLYKN
jgi:hypothetical protein